jgi:hypothetical protein
MWVYFDDIDPEVDPPLHPTWLAIERAGEVAGKVVDKVRLSLEPGINGPDQAKDDA